MIKEFQSVILVKCAKVFVILLILLFLSNILINKEKILKNMKSDPDGIIWGSIIARGGFGAVFTCEYEGKTLAGKRIPLNGTKEEQIQLMNEINIIERMNHPNIISLEKKFIRDKEVILLMAKYDGSLEDEVMKRSKAHNYFTASQIIEIFSQILNGLLHIHSKGIAHRDLKVI